MTTTDTDWEICEGHHPPPHRRYKRMCCGWLIYAEEGGEWWIPSKLGFAGSGHVEGLEEAKREAEHWAQVARPLD